MSDFDALLEEYLGDADARTDQVIVVRRLWFYDFVDNPTRVWQGKGRLFTTDGNVWFGTINDLEQDIHQTPLIQDGRDGTSAQYQFTLNIPDLPDESAQSLYEALKADQFRVLGRSLTCYMAIFNREEGLRPQTPIKFLKQLTMQTPKFSESLVTDAEGKLVKVYQVTITARDGNIGRANKPSRTYNDTVQKEYARQLGVTSEDRGCEYIAGLVNRTYVLP